MYPFRPKSTAYLKAGQFWSVPLRAGGYACGVVIARRRNGENLDKRIFLAGLLDWSGEQPPSPYDVEGRAVRERGFAHIKAITESGGDILGEVSPKWEYPEEMNHTDSISTWGYGVICRYAEKHFGA